MVSVFSCSCAWGDIHSWTFSHLMSGLVTAKKKYNDIIMNAMASLITSLSAVYSTVASDADQRKYQSSALLAFVRGIHRWPVNSPHKGPVTRKMFPFDDVIMRRSRGRPLIIWIAQRVPIRSGASPQLNRLTACWENMLGFHTMTNINLSAGDREGI